MALTVFRNYFDTQSYSGCISLPQEILTVASNVEIGKYRGKTKWFKMW